MNDLNLESIERLAEKVLSGEVVFFVGAGFSVDSEKNSAGRLIGRLLIRFETMAKYIGDHNKTSGDQATNLLKALARTFSIPDEKQTFCPDKESFEKNVKKLSSNYFLINDWMCSAFSHLLSLLGGLPDTEAAVKAINESENEIRKLVSGDAVELEKIDFKLLKGLNSQQWGKALFLDTMGFNNKDIMCGILYDEHPDKISASFRGRLLPRHHVLARLAREGLSPLLVTTNYDLLLEGAYLRAGFEYRYEKQASSDDNKNSMLQYPYQSFAKIARATDFFRFGTSHRNARILKMHGCVSSYREARKITQEWRDYLPSMVFTFREIQNWRNDAWSRDYLRTLLRTRTIVFCGYSGIDPVVHDTFRSVSEEMACYCSAAGGDSGVSCICDQEDTPTFYFGGMKDTGFHGLEMLRASSRAIGLINPDLTKHSNYIRFHFWKDDREPKELPGIDDLMLWLFHRTFRLRQEQLLHTSLGTMVSMLLGHPCPEWEFQQLQCYFYELCNAERKAVAELCNAKNKAYASGKRTCFERVVDWSMHFHAGMLRELVETEQMAKQNGPSQAYWQGRKQQYLYHAIGNHPGLSTWAVVVEIALRKMIAYWRGKPNNWAEDTVWVVPGRTWSPSIHFARDEEQPSPTCLTICLAWPDGPGRMPQPKGAFRKNIVWNLYPHAMPWPSGNGRRFDRAGGTPRARLLWEVATCATERLEQYGCEISSLLGNKI